MALVNQPEISIDEEKDEWPDPELSVFKTIDRTAPPTRDKNDPYVWEED